MTGVQTCASDLCINHTAPPGTPNGPEGMVHFLKNILRSAFSNITVTIHDQIAEADKVVTRKTITGIHSGEFMGAAATNKIVNIEVTDIIRLQNDKYTDHWGMSNIPSVVAELANK